MISLFTPPFTGGLRFSWNTERCFQIFSKHPTEGQVLLLLHNKTCMIHVNGKYGENLYLVMCTGRQNDAVAVCGVNIISQICSM